MRLAKKRIFGNHAINKQSYKHKRTNSPWVFLKCIVLVRNVTNCVSQVPIVSHIAWYCTQPEVKFDAFKCLKHKEEKLIGMFFFFDFHQRTTWRFDQVYKTNFVIYTLNQKLDYTLPLTRQVYKTIVINFYFSVFSPSDKFTIWCQRVGNMAFEDPDTVAVDV